LGANLTCSWRMRGEMKIAIYLAYFARVAFAFLMISGSINAVATADELKRVSANGTVLAYIAEASSAICGSLSRSSLQPPQ